MILRRQQIRQILGVIFVLSAAALVSQCGADGGDDDEGNGGTPVESPLPTDWDGKQDWTESKWSLEDE